MNWRKVGWGVLLLAGMAAAQVPEKHEIKSYSPEDGIVKIKTDSGITNRLFSSFSTEEQKHISDWFADKQFRASGLQVKIEKRETTSKTDVKEGQGNRIGEVDHIFYVIELENRTTVPFKNVEISCRIFYETQGGKKEEKRCARKALRLDLLPGQTQIIKTQSVSIRDEIVQTPGINTPSVSTPFGSFGGGNSGGKPTVYYKERLRGLHVSVSKPDRTGADMMLEFEAGRIPDEDERADYKEDSAAADSLNKISLTKQAKINPDIKSSPLSPEDNIAAHIKRAEQGSWKSSYFLCTHYHRTGDSEKMKQWVTKTRELLGQQPPSDQIKGIKQRLDQIEADSAGAR